MKLVYCDADACKHNADGMCECKMRCWPNGVAAIKPQTNSDRIRSMTDEELAEHLYRWDNSPLHASRERWLDWLKAPADKEGEK